MSRNQPPSAARYKISNPQPLSSSNNFGSDMSPYAIGGTSAAQSYQGGPSASYPTSGVPQTAFGPHAAEIPIQQASAGPSRPARSRMRETLGSGQGHSPMPSSSSRQQLGIQTQNLRRPSHDRAPSSRLHEVPSPATPLSPAGALSPQGDGLFSDPFAADRHHRTELRAQHNAAAQQATMPVQSSRDGGQASDKLRNAVGAFIQAGRQREDPSNAVRRPPKSQDRPRRPARREELDLEITGTGKFAQVDAVLQKIKKDWPFVLESDFSPSSLALSLLSQVPSSTLPQHPSLQSFLRLHEALSTALQTAVQAHFQTFAASLPGHGAFLATLGRAQQQVKRSRDELKAAREGFAGKGKAELSGVRARERMVRDMLRILDVIDGLRQVPDRLESLIGGKQFLQSAVLLVRSLKTINRSEVADIPALTDLRAYFVSQETTLTEILIEELHNHLYLKSFYSDSRWRAYTPGQHSLFAAGPHEDQDSINLTAANSVAASTANSPDMRGLNSEKPGAASEATSTRFSRYLATLSTKPAQNPLLEYQGEVVADIAPSGAIVHKRAGSSMMGQASSTQSLAALAAQNTPESDNPEADSFTYIETLLESLAVLGRLGTALERVAARVSTEIHALVATTLDEVEERSEQRREDEEATGSTYTMSNGDAVGTPMPGDAAARRRSLIAPAQTLRIAVALEVASPPRHALILRDLFWSLYSKLSAVLEGHRVVYEVSRWISSRREFKDNTLVKDSSNLTIPVMEIWRPVQQEVRALLGSYLVDEAAGSALDQHPPMTVNEVLREGKIARDRQKTLFRFSETQNRTLQKDVKAMDEHIQQALRASVPGLVNIQTANDSSSQQNVMQGISAKTAEERGSSSGPHRRLLPANAFNVTTLFEPTVAFIDRATAIIPPGFEEETAGFGSGLEDFVVKVFLPQLDERVTSAFQQAASGYDAYQIDRSMIDEVAKPPLKSSVRVMGLIHTLCVMLQTSPFHRENYSRLIVGVIVQYYQQCSSRFRELATSARDSGAGGQDPLALPAVWAQREDIIAISTDVRAALPTDRKELAAICAREVKLETELLNDKPLVESQLLASSRKLEALGHLAESLKWFIDSLLDLQEVSEDPLSPTWDEDRLGPQGRNIIEANPEPKLPLTKAMSLRFEAIIQTFEQLADMILNTIRLEIRGRVICNLSASMRKGDFRLESEALEIDPDILDLTQHLSSADAVTESTLSSEDRAFVLRGLGSLTDHVFIHSARSIKVVNAAGVRKIRRDILALQQALRTVGNTPDEGILARAVAYWDLYDLGPKAMLASIRTPRPMFAFEDYNTMLNLQCRDDKSSAPSSELNTFLIDLHALSMSIDDWEIGGA